MDRKDEVLHYHIRWVNGSLDWEAFSTSVEAEVGAKQLAWPGELYAIDAHDGDCPICRETRKENLTDPSA